MGALHCGKLGTDSLPQGEAVLHALIQAGDVALTLSDHGFTAELRGRGEVTLHAQWLVIEMLTSGGRLHICRHALDHYEVVDTYGHQRAVRFVDVDGHTLFTCTMVGTAEGASDFTPDRLAQFSRLLRRE